MGKVLKFRRRPRRTSRAKAGVYRSPLIRGRNRAPWGKWHRRIPWRPILLLALLVVLWPFHANGGLAHASFLPWMPKPTAADPEAAWFRRCTGPTATRYTCVVDGDTLYYRGEKIRVIGIDTPELFSPRCAEEERMAEQAAQLLTKRLNAGPFSIAKPFLSPSTDKYGRALRHVTREGVPLGDALVNAGLAHRYGGGARAGWCG